MILNKTLIAKIDSTGLILKRIETTQGIFANRKIAINNGYYNSEKKRLLFNKPLLQGLMQTKHIHYNKKKDAWSFSVHSDTVEEAQTHADKFGRLFTAYLQLSKEQWDDLDWNTAENYALKLARRGVSIVPYPLPLDATSRKWTEKKKEIYKQLNRSQELMAVLSSNHFVHAFPAILEKEFQESKLLGIHCNSIKEPITQSNLNALYELTRNLGAGHEVPLVIGFCPKKYVKNFQNVSSVYLLGLYGIDVVSYFVYSPMQIAQMGDAAPEEYPYYDSIEGGYNKTENQVVWYGQDLTRVQLSSISANEGLDPYHANTWADYLRETEDMYQLNNAIISGNAKELIESKSRWSIVKDEILVNNRQTRLDL